MAKMRRFLSYGLVLLGTCFIMLSISVKMISNDA